MRHARVKVGGTGCYHVVSRIVDRAFKLDDAEMEIFRRMMRKAEAFSGVSKDKGTGLMTRKLLRGRGGG